MNSELPTAEAQQSMLREFYEGLLNERYRLTKIREDITDTLHKVKNTNYPIESVESKLDTRGNQDYEYDLFLILECFKKENDYLQEQVRKLQNIVSSSWGYNPQRKDYVNRNFPKRHKISVKGKGSGNGKTGTGFHTGF